ncbi:MAG: prolyl aminopeptidase [Rhabdochlamydiaceae bacterium]
MSTLYSDIEPYNKGFLRVDEYDLYWEESGNPKGMPILFLHGGPGVGCEEKNRRFFDPSFYRIILMDQRGAGLSKPYYSINQNTTWDLVEDLEKLRRHLNIKKWIVFGGSWGSTLALVYTQTYPLSVEGLILRGIFLGTQKEINWFYQEGASHFFPEAWNKFKNFIPELEQDNLLRAYKKRLNHVDFQVRQTTANMWGAWERIALKIDFGESPYQNLTYDPKTLGIAQIETHYFINNCFFQEENFILKNMHKIQHIPGIIIHGRYDMICLPSTAWCLHKAWANSSIQIIPFAGHSSSESGITSALIKAANRFKDLRLTF